MSNFETSSVEQYCWAFMNITLANYNQQENLYLALIKEINS